MKNREMQHINWIILNNSVSIYRKMQQQRFDKEKLQFRQNYYNKK